MLILVSGAALVTTLVVAYLASRSPAAQPIAIYDRGQATLAMNGLETGRLPLIAAGATLLSAGGASLAWQGADGWYLSLNGPFGFSVGASTLASTPAATGSEAPEAAPIEASGSLQLAGGDVRRWAGFDSRACVILYTEVRATHIAGSIRCKGLAWYDGTAVEHIQPLDLPPFDIDVEFEAAGSGAPPPSSAP
ncbi:MAG: hypothetical protein ABJC39_11170 [Chloroflexota bacterium]